MKDNQNPSKTMYIKFPTVTKLVCPFQSPNEHQNFRTTSYKAQLPYTSHIKLGLVSRTQAFKIIQLPEKNQIMNICTMTMRQKPKEDDKEHSVSERSARKKKSFSTTKFNSFKQQAENEIVLFKNPLNVKKSASIGNMKKLLKAPPQIKIDFPEFYVEVNKLIALSFGFLVDTEGFMRARRARIDLGNNGVLVKQVVKKRVWWNATTDDQKVNEGENINLLWTQHIISQRNIEKLQQNNNLCLTPQNRKYEDTKPTFSKNIDRLINQLPKIKQLFFTQWEEEPLRIKDLIFRIEQQSPLTLNPGNLIINNHMPNNWQITNKKLLYKNMVNYYQKNDRNPHQKLPKTYHLTCFNWQQVIKDVRGDISKWIIKPGEFTNRGKGIIVFRTTKEAIDHILMNPPKTQAKTFLLQEYITPMLYLQRKFDIRCFVLGVQIGNCLKFFWYEQGYIRTASQKFSLKKVSRSIHLTNQAVQKHMKNYGQHESANKLSYSDIDKYFTNNTTYNFYNEILPEMKRISRDMCHSVGDNQRIGAGTGISFELFGLDFLVDCHGKPWLIEANTNPSLDVSCSLLSRVLPELLDNTFRLVCDVFFPPKKAPEYAQHFLQNNKFSLIYSRTSEPEMQSNKQ